LGILTGTASGVSSRGPSFSTAHGVIHRVHGNSAGAGPDPLPTIPASLTHGFQLVVAVRHRTHCRHTGTENAAGFPGRHAQNAVFIFFSVELGMGSGGTGQSASLSGPKLNIVNDGSQG